MISFKKFEAASRLLEGKTPYEVDQALLESADLTVDDLVSVNEGFIKDLFGGIFKKFKDKLSRMVPGSVLKQIDEILGKYTENQQGIYSKIKREKDKQYKAAAELQADPDNETVKKRYDEILERSSKAIKAIEDANKVRLSSIEKQLDILTRDKDDSVKDYVDLKIAEVKEKMANQQLKDAEEFADEASLKKIEDDVKSAKARRDEAAKALQASLDDQK